MARFYDLAKATSLLSNHGIICTVSGGCTILVTILMMSLTQPLVMDTYTFQPPLQLETNQALLLRVHTGVYGSSAPASGLKQVRLYVLLGVP